MTSDDVPGRATVEANGPGGLAAGLDEMAAATDRLLATVDALDEAALHADCLLPGWTRGHVLAHVARNADAMVNLVTSARTGQPLVMYPGGRVERDAQIERAAGRPLGDARLDLAESAERLLAAFADFPTEGLGREVTLASGGTGFGWEIPLLRTREVEIHHVDLDAGYTPDDWSPEFAARTLDQLSPFFLSARECPVGSLVATDADSRWEVAADGPELSGRTSDLAAWLVGRSPGQRLALAGEGVVPAAPTWV